MELLAVEQSNPLISTYLCFWSILAASPLRKLGLEATEWVAGRHQMQCNMELLFS
jgi:hypothetical protein